MKYEKVYIPIDVEQAAENGEVLIATGKVTISNEKAVMEFIPSQHLKPIEEVFLFTKKELENIIAEFHEAGLRGEILDYKPILFK